MKKQLKNAIKKIKTWCYNNEVYYSEKFDESLQHVEIELNDYGYILRFAIDWHDVYFKASYYESEDETITEISYKQLIERLESIYKKDELIESYENTLCSIKKLLSKHMAIE